MKYDVITIGGATEDITFFTKEGLMVANREDILRQKLLAFEYGTKIKIDSSRYTFGGGAANAAICLSALGLKVASVISIGDDERGRKILGNLKKHNIDTKFVQKNQNMESGFSFLLIGQNHEHIVFSNRAANNELKIKSYQLNFLKDTKWIYLSSLSGEWKEDLENIFKIKETKIAWNPGHVQLAAGAGSIKKYLAETDLLILNKDEAIELVVSDKEYKNKPIKFLNNIENLLKIIKSWCAGLVVITNGGYGTDVYDGAKIYRQPAIRAKKVADTTGVGDAFGSSFLAGLQIYDGNIKKALLLAAKNSSSVVTKQGAQNGLLTIKDFKKL